MTTPAVGTRPVPPRTVRPRPGVRGGAGGILALALVVATVVAGAWLLQPPASPGSPAGATGAAPASASGAPRVGEPAPDFSVLATDGRTLTLSALRGRPVWLSFGATWCAPCRVEAPDMQAANDGRAAIVAVYMGEDSPTAAAYAARMGLTFTHVADPDAALSSAYGVRGIPVHYFLDADGVVRATRVGILGPDVIAAELAAAAASA